MPPLNWLTLRSSIHACIAFTDNVVYGYNHCQSSFNKRYINNATSIAFGIKVTLPIFRKLIEAFVQLVSSEVNPPDPLPTFWRGAVLLLSSKKGRGLQCIQMPLSKFPIIGGSDYLIVPVMYFHLVSLRSLWRMNSFLSLYFYLIFFRSGSPLSLFCDFRTCTVWFSNILSSTVVFHLAISYQSPFSTLTMTSPHVQEKWLIWTSSG